MQMKKRLHLHVSTWLQTVTDGDKHPLMKRHQTQGDTVVEDGANNKF